MHQRETRRRSLYPRFLLRRVSLVRLAENLNLRRGLVGIFTDFLHTIDLLSQAGKFHHLANLGIIKCQVENDAVGTVGIDQAQEDFVFDQGS